MAPKMVTFASLSLLLAFSIVDAQFPGLPPPGFSPPFDPFLSQQELNQASFEPMRVVCPLASNSPTGTTHRPTRNAPVDSTSMIVVTPGGSDQDDFPVVNATLPENSNGTFLRINITVNPGSTTNNSTADEETTAEASDNPTDDSDTSDSTTTASTPSSSRSTRGKHQRATTENSRPEESSNTGLNRSRHHNTEEPSRGKFFNPSPTTLNRFTSQQNREQIQPLSLQENNQNENEFSNQEELQPQEEQRIREYLRDQRIRKEMKRQRLLKLLRSPNQQVDSSWISGSSPREGLETSNLQSSQVPTENTGEIMMTNEEFREFMKVVKNKHREHRPVIIVMDEDQVQQQQPTDDEDQNQ